MRITWRTINESERRSRRTLTKNNVQPFNVDKKNEKNRGGYNATHRFPKEHRWFLREEGEADERWGTRTAIHQILTQPHRNASTRMTVQNSEHNNSEGTTRANVEEHTYRPLTKHFSKQLFDPIKRNRWTETYGSGVGSWEGLVLYTNSELNNPHFRRQPDSCRSPSWGGRCKQFVRIW